MSEVPESVGPAALVDPVTPAFGSRRAPTPAPSIVVRRRRTPHVPTAALIALVAVGSALLGAWVTRHHQRANDVVVSVNGEVIDKNQFLEALQAQAGPTVIQKLVADELMIQFARKHGCSPSDAEVNKRYQELSLRSDFQEDLALHALSPDNLKRSIQVELARAAVLSKGISISDADVHKFYAMNADPRNPQARYYTPESVTIAVISTADEAEARTAAAALAAGIPFSTAAQTYSQDASKTNGGLMAPIYRGRTRISQIPGMEDFIFGLKIGAQTTPQPIAGGWWIIRCLDKKPASTQPFDRVKEECRTGAMLMKGLPVNGKKVDADFRAFQRASNIQAFWQQYAGVVKPPGA